MVRPKTQFDTSATRMPKTILNWNIPASFPRDSGGAISEMNIGAATVAAPTPNPPTKRATMNVYTPGAIAEPNAEMKYRNPTAMSVRRRPNRSAGTPPKIAPSTVPHNAIPVAQPWRAESSCQIR